MKLKEKLKKKQPEKKNKGISEKKSFKEKIKSSFNGKYIKNGSYSMLISVIFIVIFIVINMIVNVLPTKYSEIDVSDQKLFSIGKQTEDFLKKLDKDKKELIILLENTGEKTYRYGKYFEIEKKINGKWYQLVQNDKDSEDHGEVLESKNNIDLNYNIEQYYNSLTVGEYRIIIQLYYMKDEKDWDYKTYNVALEFNI